MEAPALPESLWALEPKALERLRLAVSQPIGATMSGRSSLTADAPLYTVEDGVAVIRFEGLVTKRPSFWSWLFGGSAVTETAQAALAGALEDPAVRSVLLVVDSPGGTVAGTEELAEAVFRARGVKPITAYASDMCASAAYWVASQAAKLYANATATVGSIGVYAVNVDLSRMYRNEGLEVDVIKSAPGKGAGIRGTQWTPEQRADLQREIDALGSEFVETVRRARPAAIAAADGRCFTAREGLSLGLVDGITTLADLLGQMKAEAVAWPAVTVSVDLEHECTPEQPEAAATTSPAERVAHDPGPKEDNMSDTTKAELDAMRAELTQRLDAVAATVGELKAERELDALVSQAKVDRKIQNADTEAAVRAAGAKSLEAARALVAALKVAGPEGGSIVEGAGSAAAEAAGKVLGFRKPDLEDPKTRKRLHEEAKAMVARGEAKDYTSAWAAVTGKAVA